VCHGKFRIQEKSGFLDARKARRGTFLVIGCRFGEQKSDVEAQRTAKKSVGRAERNGGHYTGEPRITPTRKKKAAGVAKGAGPLLQDYFFERS
jgi:hypothetical protein